MRSIYTITDPISLLHKSITIRHPRLGKDGTKRFADKGRDGGQVLLSSRPIHGLALHHARHWRRAHGRVCGLHQHPTDAAFGDTLVSTNRWVERCVEQKTDVWNRIFPFGVTVGALTIVFVLIAEILIQQKRLEPGTVVLGAFILFVLYLTGLIETAIQLFGPSVSIVSPSEREDILILTVYSGYEQQLPNICQRPIAIGRQYRDPGMAGATQHMSVLGCGIRILDCGSGLPDLGDHHGEPGKPA